jgi:hypothetical protein
MGAWCSVRNAAGSIFGGAIAGCGGSATKAGAYGMFGWNWRHTNGAAGSAIAFYGSDFLGFCRGNDRPSHSGAVCR